VLFDDGKLKLRHIYRTSFRVQRVYGMLMWDVFGHAIMLCAAPDVGGSGTNFVCAPHASKVCPTFGGA
jgi:hypothetical protein